MDFKIYTKTGDKGETRLASGQKVSKDSSRIDAYGQVDELNSSIALVRDELFSCDQEKFKDLVEKILTIQNELFDLGSELATPVSQLNPTKQQVLTAEQYTRLEQEIDSFSSELKPLTNFVLPGGHRANSLTHLSRTICRRAERACIKLSKQEDVRSEALIYLNRLSDWLFTASRVISHRLNITEIIWNPRK